MANFQVSITRISNEFEWFYYMASSYKPSSAYCYAYLHISLHISLRVIFFLQENICALCDAAIDIDMMDHGCYNGYNQVHVDDAGYVYPMLGKFYLLYHNN